MHRGGEAGVHEVGREEGVGEGGQPNWARDCDSLQANLKSKSDYSKWLNFQTTMVPKTKDQEFYVNPKEAPNHFYYDEREAALKTGKDIFLFFFKLDFSAKARWFYSLYSELQVVFGKLEMVFEIPNCQVWLKLSVLNITDNMGFTLETWKISVSI